MWIEQHQPRSDKLHVVSPTAAELIKFCQENYRAGKISKADCGQQMREIILEDRRGCRRKCCRDWIPPEGR